MLIACLYHSNKSPHTHVITIFHSYSQFGNLLIFGILYIIMEFTQLFISLMSFQFQHFHQVHNHQEFHKLLTIQIIRQLRHNWHIRHIFEIQSSFHICQVLCHFQYSINISKSIILLTNVQLFVFPKFHKLSNSSRTLNSILYPKQN